MKNKIYLLKKYSIILSLKDIKTAPTPLREWALMFCCAISFYYFSAITSISTITPLGRSRTAKAARAG